MKMFIEAGEFVSTHGIGGELRLYPWSDSIDFLASFKVVYLDAEGSSPLTIEAVRPHKNICLVKLEGVGSVEQARRFIGKKVYVARADIQLEPGRFLIQDIIGAKVLDAETGVEYGMIQNITHPGRHDVYEIVQPDGSVVLFPAVPEFVKEIDPKAGIVKILPIDGMFE